MSGARPFLATVALTVFTVMAAAMAIAVLPALWNALMPTPLTLTGRLIAAAAAVIAVVPLFWKLRSVEKSSGALRRELTLTCFAWVGFSAVAYWLTTQVPNSPGWNPVLGLPGLLGLVLLAAVVIDRFRKPGPAL